MAQISTIATREYSFYISEERSLKDGRLQWPQNALVYCLTDPTCPCCSQTPYEQCCKPFHEGKEPGTPLELMRSRYSAYALKLPKYIQKTTHPKSPYFEKELSKWLAGIEEFCKTTEFVRLEILGHGPTHVYFAAHLKQQGRPFTLTEKSRFEQIGSSWRYLDGEIFKT